MSLKTANELIAAAVGNFGSNMSQLSSGGFTRQDKHELERYLLIANNLFSLVKSDYQAWRARIAHGDEAYSPECEQQYHKLLSRLVDIFGDIDARRKKMESVIDDHVSGGQDVFITCLELQTLLKEKWVSVAGISMVFEEMEVDGENEEFMNRFLARTA